MKSTLDKFKEAISDNSEEHFGELILNEIECNAAVEKIHSIHMEEMGRFAEWACVNGWWFNVVHKYWNNTVKNFTTTELLQEYINYLKNG